MPSASSISCCALTLEIAASQAELQTELSFNRGTGHIEELLKNLKLPDDIMEARERGHRSKDHSADRGRREMRDITLKTFTDFEDGTSASAAGTGTGGESSSCSEGGQMSKESTPATVGSTCSSRPEDGQMKFSSGNPFVEVTKGLLHLFKENETTSLEDGVIRSQMMCMLGVPAKVKTPDLLQFTAPCHAQLESMRIIDDSTPNMYMALLKFRCQEAADEFYQAFNGLRYNSFEQECCSLVYVSKVETYKEAEYYPMSGHTELPVCSICLERMDESVSTVLTILCNHTFHGSCLAQWEDSTCPVCRYIQTPEVVAEQICSECQSPDDLWICLVCGYVGCGRYVDGHSHAHFLATDHHYTMELGSNRVWDYVGDNFVHRLVQTDGADGKLVEAEGSNPVAGGAGGGGKGEMCGGMGGKVDGVRVNNDEKIDSIQLEYTYLLTSQLEAQRKYYEDKMGRLEDASHRELEEVMNRARSSLEENQQMEDRLTTTLKEKAKQETKVSSLSTKMAKLNVQLQEETTMNKSLRKNQGEWQKKLKDLEVRQTEKDKQIEDLQEQLRDIMFFMQAQNTIANSDMKEEIQDGNVTVGAAAGTSDKSGKKKKKRK